jgi:hypothetical protein
MVGTLLQAGVRMNSKMTLKTASRSVFLLFAALSCIPALCANAAGEMLRDDPRRPVEQISRDLGVQPAEFRACFANVSPVPAGGRHTEERNRTNKAKLLGCLRGANPKITNESLDAVMDKYRPGGHEAQVPDKL